MTDQKRTGGLGKANPNTCAVSKFLDTSLGGGSEGRVNKGRRTLNLFRKGERRIGDD